MRHIRLSFLLPVLVAGLAVAGCGGSGGGSLSGGSIAQVGDVTITKAQFDNLIERAKQSYEKTNQSFPKPGTPDYDRVKDDAVHFLVQRALFEQEAEKMGVDVSQGDVEKRLTQIKKQYFKGSEDAYQKQLKDQGLTQEEVNSDLKDQLISQKLFDKVTADVKVSQKDVEKYYESHEEQYEQPESRTVRHILIAVCGPNTPKGQKCRTKAKAKAFAEQLETQLKGGASFPALAKKYSQDPGSASQGGKLEITRGQTVPPFDQTAFNLGTGTVSAPVETQYGFHIIEPVAEVKAASRTPLKEVRQSIYQQLLQQKKQQKMAAWVNDTNDKYDIKYADGYEPTSTSTGSTAGTTAPATTAATTTNG